jgi:anti-anti-sigma regulatory factor
MNYEFFYEEDFLIIRLAGTAKVNDRLFVEDHLAPYLTQSRPKVIIDLANLNGKGDVFIAGVLNTIKKKVQLLGGEVKLCSLEPGLYRYLQDNRLDKIFDIGQSIGEMKAKFMEKSDGS